MQYKVGRKNTQVSVVLFAAMFLIFAFAVFSTFLAQGSATGYYWRDYDGFIPPDAFVAARDDYGNPIYIGQVLHSDKLIPAKILHNDRAAYYELDNKEYEKKENVKIFCTKDPAQFEWIPTSSQELNTITGKFLVKGGYQPNSSTYIGRTTSVGETVLGKVIADTSKDALHVTQKGKSHSFTTFEVLSCKQKAKNDQVTTIVVKSVD
ncbi:hypothetical protein PPYR_14159 [Photinus pyralis]|uniref:Uncharacterized protein n=1 Tax=Photinus pyralis TaxID=7054 RepID=A0A1Y1LD62_PHOPY|nr:uncharacterized protein LOC116180623 [Photinus pyralis]KAB0792200.1 hypothetical protein PPYR_14159 [Photinus pyralis]